jgi:hypothetical protein
MLLCPDGRCECERIGIPLFGFKIPFQTIVMLCGEKNNRLMIISKLKNRDFKMAKKAC